MEFYKELMLGNMPSQPDGGTGMVALLMPGVAPTNGAELKAAVDIYDIQDIYAKCLGFVTLGQARNGSAVADSTITAFTQALNRTALKKGDLDLGATFDNTGANAGLRKASLPDRFFLCRKGAPFDRITEKTGSAGWPMTNLMAWSFYDNLWNAQALCNIGKSTHPDAGFSGCIEFEWDTARNLAGIVRSSTKYPTQGWPYMSVAVDAWNGAAWEQVLATNTKNSVLASNYVAFSKRILTTKIRIKWSALYSGYQWTIPHGILPVEVAADAPAPSDVADIGWVMLLPLYGSRWPAVAACGKLSNMAYPVPAIIAKAGGPGDGVGVEIIFNKKTGILSTDKITCTGFKVTSTNLVGV